MTEQSCSIETPRLVISSMTDDELQRVVDGESDDILRQAYSEMLEGCRREKDKRLWYTMWAIRPGEKDAPVIGSLCFKGLTAGVAEIGYGIDEAFEGKGYMTEAVTALTRWALEHGARRVEAETEEDNIASRRVLEKAGFLPTGEMGEEGPRYASVTDIIRTRF